MEFDFTAWAKLARDNPAEFERRRALVLRAEIDGAPAAFRQRMDELQSCLDLERKRAAAPSGTRLPVNTLLWAGLYRLRRELMSVSSSAARAETTARRSADVIPLRSARERRGSVVPR